MGHSLRSVSFSKFLQRNAMKHILFCLAYLLVICSSISAQDSPFQPGDNVVYIGNTLADRMQHHGWLETYIHALHPDHDLTFRNLGYSGDEVKLRQRADNFGDANQWLTKCEADVIACFFGYNEALKGDAGLETFSSDLGDMVDEMRAQKYNGESAPRIFVFSPIAHEDIGSPHLPDGSKNNRNLAAYTRAMRKVCSEKKVPFVDLFAITQRLYKNAKTPLTMNGIHLLDHGNKAVAKSIIAEFAPGETLPSDDEISKLRKAVLEKNYEWFSRYRVVDEYNVFGGRSELSWFGQSNADVMMREMEIFDVKTSNRDRKVWAVAKGQDYVVKDDNLPEEQVVKTNKPGELEGGAHRYLGAEEAIGEMEIHKDLDVNVFASEEMFPRLINPVQMAVDTDSRLWASVWPSYPHWNPTQPRRDALVILPDEDKNGVADELIVFADELNSVTGFEFWGGGVLVAAPPEIWYLKDTDGDDKADVKIRMLQGVSSADTHHSANAMLVGPDGWLNWSRGIFNVAAFETPTQTYRSGESGVHRFNPRTFEVDFHYPIGPNPHGHFFDRWGFEFANDGTSGTGGYVGIGKGLRPGNKEWFDKEWRPVAATGQLSSSHFPEELQHNFLICNTIGFLGVLQYEVEYNGAEIRAVRTDNIVQSKDPNFRPSDIEVGGDGALYVSDWHNVLIGHMQHNMRDPNRDDEHGRIYRISVKGSAPLEPVKMKGKPINEVLQNFFSKENGTRYRTRLELSGRDRNEVARAIVDFTVGLNPANDGPERDEAQALLESLWVLEEQRVPSINLVRRVFAAKEARVRAAAIRTLGHWAGRVQEWEDVLAKAAVDESALVRAEAIKAAVEFKGPMASQVFFDVANGETDPELDDVIEYASRELDVSTLLAKALDAGEEFSPAMRRYAFESLEIDDLEKLGSTKDVFLAILARPEATTQQLTKAFEGYATLEGTDELGLLIKLVEDEDSKIGNVQGLGSVLARQPASELARIQGKLENYALNGKTKAHREFGYSGWIAAAGPGDAFLAATKTKEQLRDFLAAVPKIAGAPRKQLYEKIEPLTSELPVHLQGEASSQSSVRQGMKVEFFDTYPKDLSVETLDQLQPAATGIVPDVSKDVPQRTKEEAYALRFTSWIDVPANGRYRFRIESDDGSRVYLDDTLIIDNDGSHGMTDKRTKGIRLTAGPHKYVVTYGNETGFAGLSTGWKGNGFGWQKVPSDLMSVRSSKSLKDEAIRALASIPGFEIRKVAALTRLVANGNNRDAAIRALRTVDPGSWPEKEIAPFIDNLAGYLTEMPARFRTSRSSRRAIEYAKTLVSRLPDDQANSINERLDNLDVRVIAIGTVPTRMIFDKERIAVKAGTPVEFRFSNTDHMPHNFAVVEPGSLYEVGELAESTGRDEDAVAREYIPKSEKVLVASKLLQPGDTQTLTFEVPKRPGIYPYVCTYPGHYRRMYGALFVVENLEEYQADPAAYVAANGLKFRDELLELSSRGQEWNYDDLIASMEPELPKGRSYEVGQELFKVASCSGCHQLKGEGRNFGPNLAELDAKKQNVQHILRSIVEPSKEIEEKYRSYTFALDSGKSKTGMITEEDASTVRIVVDPLAKDEATVIDKDEIEERIKSEVSMMPAGLLDRLSREEILDLIAYVYAKGDLTNPLFAECFPEKSAK